MIVLPPIVEHMSPPDEDEVDRLLQAYPLCTFFILSGPVPLPADRLKKFVRLDPKLGPDDESSALSYVSALRLQAGITETANGI
jgi:hypothetical protein